jgi:hypothetical protein
MKEATTLPKVTKGELVKLAVENERRVGEFISFFPLSFQSVLSY